MQAQGRQGLESRGQGAVSAVGSIVVYQHSRGCRRASKGYLPFLATSELDRVNRLQCILLNDSTAVFTSSTSISSPSTISRCTSGGHSRNFSISSPSMKRNGPLDSRTLFLNARYLANGTWPGLWTHAASASCRFMRRSCHRSSDLIRPKR